MSKMLRFLSARQIVGRAPGCRGDTPWRAVRHFADKQTTNLPNQIVKMGPASRKQGLRVRRVRPADVPQVMRFVRESTRASRHHGSIDTGSWSSSQPVLDDLVARALAQGHSMVAEGGWSPQLQGLAAGAATCPWDAALLDQWARCVKCRSSRDLVSFTAHCLRAPALHHKYRLHRILQVILIVPPDPLKNFSEIVEVLVKAAIKRGRDVGFPLIRFDVTNDFEAKVLEDLNLTKEWMVSYNIVPEGTNIIRPDTISPGSNTALDKGGKANFIAVYTTFTKPAAK